MGFYYQLPGFEKNFVSGDLVSIEGTNHDDYIPSLIRKNKEFYELDLLEHLYQNGPSGGLFVDVGANIGNHTVYFAKYLANKVVAVEPEPKIYQQLQRNIIKNQLRNVIPLQMAFGEQSGRGLLHLPDGAENNVGRTQVLTNEQSTFSEDSVRIDRLDRVLDDLELGPVSLIKIDVEGMQIAVLKGASQTIAAYKPDLVIEAPSADEQADVCSFLSMFNYVYIGTFCRTPTMHFSSAATMKAAA